MSWAEAVKILGGTAGTIALVWRFVDEFGTWLRIAVKVEREDHGIVTALTTVDNKGNRPKPVEFACLLVAPEGEDPVASANELFRLTYRASLDTAQLDANTVCSVRFFIFVRNRLHRSTQDAFFNSSPSSSAPSPSTKS